IQTFKDGTTGPNYVQVTDKRGTQEGWTLSAVQNGQFKTAQNEELVGAALSIANAGVTSIVDAAYAPTPTAAHTFVPGTEVELVKAEDGKGMGTWVYRFGKDATEGATAVKLNVPGKAIKLAKEYRTTLTWTLKSVPTNVGG
ncbi:WxL domain-containing protein, partial [Enterococcus faecalis]